MADTRYSETVDASRWADALLGGAAAFAILLAIVMFAGGEALAAVIAGLVGIAMFAAFRTFTTLRIELDDSEVRASFGNFKHSIPLQRHPAGDRRAVRLAPAWRVGHPVWVQWPPCLQRAVPPHRCAVQPSAPANAGTSRADGPRSSPPRC